MTIWKRPIDLDRLNATSENTLIDHLKIIYSKVGVDFIEATNASLSFHPPAVGNATWRCFSSVG